MANKHNIEEQAARLYIKIANLNQEYYTTLATEICNEFIPKKKKLKILDVGTGPGLLPLEILAQRPDIFMQGTDLTKNMILYAKNNAVKAEKLGAIKPGKLRFNVSDANDLSFRSNYFDLVISTGAFHAFQTPVKALNEYHRVLQPQGLCVIYDPVRISMEKEIINQLPADLQNCWEKYALKRKKKEEPIVPECCSVEKVEDFIRQSNFQNSKKPVLHRKDDSLKIVLQKI